MRKIDKNEAWSYALGMIKVDGLEPSADFLRLTEKEKKGEITLKQMEEILCGREYIEKTTYERIARS